MINSSKLDLPETTCPMKIDCYVDADFAGLWGSEDPDDPISAKNVNKHECQWAGIYCDNVMLMEFIDDAFSRKKG
jgi:hypothetical protein